VNELGAELDGHGRGTIAVGEDAPTDSLARFDDDDVDAVLMEFACGGEARGTGADDHDVSLVRSSIHGGWARGEGIAPGGMAVVAAPRT